MTYYYTLSGKFRGGIISSKWYNSSMIVRANGRALSLRKFVALFGLKGLNRLVRYTMDCVDDNCKIRINGVTVYVHFK